MISKITSHWKHVRIHTSGLDHSILWLDSRNRVIFRFTEFKSWRTALTNKSYVYNEISRTSQHEECFLSEYDYTCNANTTVTGTAQISIYCHITRATFNDHKQLLFEHWNDLHDMIHCLIQKLVTVTKKNARSLRLWLTQITDNEECDSSMNIFVLYKINSMFLECKAWAISAAEDKRIRLGQLQLYSDLDNYNCTGWQYFANHANI